MKNFAKPKNSRMFAMLFAKRRFYTFIVGAFFYAFTANSVANNIGYQTPLENCSTVKYGNCCLATTEGDSLSCIHIVTNNFRLKMPNNTKITNLVNNSSKECTPCGAKTVISANNVRAKNFLPLPKTEKKHKKFAKTEICSTFALSHSHNSLADSICNNNKRIGAAYLGSYCQAICECDNLRESCAFSIHNNFNNNFLQPMSHSVKNCQADNNSNGSATPCGAKTASSLAVSTDCFVSNNQGTITIFNGISNEQLHLLVKSVFSELINSGLIDLKNSKL